MSFTINEMIEKRMTNEELSDEHVQRLSYAIEYFDFNGSGESLDYWWQIRRILKARLKVMEEKKREALSERVKLAEKTLPLSGQLWEECEACGCDGPVYMSHGNRCESCAKFYK